MKDKIYTIPVTDAFSADTECAVCFMIDKIEERAVNSLVGPDNSYMQSDIREKTNAQGFCAKHYQKLFKFNNSLGLALMVETHLNKINREMPRVIDSIKKPPKSGFLSKGTAKQSPCAEYISKIVNSCYICTVIEDIFPRYMDTFIWLWKEQDEMKSLVKNGKGFCLTHFVQAAEWALANMNEKEYENFSSAIISAQMKNFQRIGDEVSWFVQKHDYRFHEEPWNNSRDSVSRSIKKLASVEAVK